MHPAFRHLLLSATALAAFQTAAAQTTVLRNDDLSSMSGWFNSSTSGISLVNGGLSVSAGRHALTYFAPSATPQTLASGESLQVTFDLSFTLIGTTSGGFRVGLFDSNGATRPTANGVFDAFQNYDGYAFTWTPNPGSGSNSLNLRKRLTDGTNQLLSSITDGTNYSVFNSGNSSSSGSASGQVFQTGTVYAATYSINRGSGNALTIDFNVTGGGAGWNFGKSYSIVGPNDLAFDAFAILSVSNNAPSSGSNFAIDNLRITHTAASSGGLSAQDVGGGAIPEPSTYALGAGLAALGLAWWRRRRRAVAQGGSS